MNTNEILRREVAKLGAIGGVLPRGRLAGALGGATGAWIASRYLPTESYAREHQLPCSAETGLTMIIGVLSELGRLQDSSEILSPNPTIAAVIGSGFMNMNLCVLTAAHPVGKAANVKEMLDIARGMEEGSVTD